MRLRTFTGPDMKSAMEEVRHALGEEAVILATSTDKRGHITITAALEMDDEPAAPPLPPPPTVPQASNRGMRGLAAPSTEEFWLEELTSLLRYHGVPEILAGRMVYKARQMELARLFSAQRSANPTKFAIDTRALTHLLDALYRFRPLPLGSPGARIMLIGPPGIGKTVCIARMATRLVMDKVPVHVITTDNKRAGGIEQLAAFTDVLQLPLTVAESGKDLKAALRALPADTNVLIDSAGVNHYDPGEIEDLRQLTTGGIFEPVLAMPAGMDSFEAADAVRALHSPTMTRMIITRADTARRFGSILASADAKGLAFANMSGSARVTGELKPLDAGALAQCLLQYTTPNAHLQSEDSSSMIRRMQTV